MRSSTEETIANGWHPRLLDSGERLHGYTRQFRYVVLLAIDQPLHCFALLAKATYAAMAMTYSYLTPDLWKETVYTKTPFQEYSEHLASTQKKYTTGLVSKQYQ